MKRAQERGALLTEEDKTIAAAVSEQQLPSAFVGVSWDRRGHKWRANLTHDGNKQHLGLFDDEREAARAVDTAARQLRGCVSLRTRKRCCTHAHTQRIIDAASISLTVCIWHVPSRIGCSSLRIR